MIIDIRTKQEFALKPIEGVMNIPERHLKDSIDLMNTFPSIIFVCPTGTNARRVAHKYKGILKVKDITGRGL